MGEKDERGKALFANLERGTGIFFYLSMLRTILYSLVSTSRSQHCKHFFKAPRVAILLEML